MALSLRLAMNEVPAPRVVFDHASVVFTTQSGETVQALTDFSLAIQPEEIVALVGPSGCGKSTALRLVAGLLKPTQGEVRVQADHAGRAWPAGRGFARVAIVFQRPTLLPWLSVLQNVLYPHKVLARRTDPALRTRALELLDMVGIADMAARMPEELSGGMQQRAAICRALLLDPKVLLMDEPFGALDALTREDLQFDLLRIHGVTRKTILLVTHSISEAVLLADRVAVMSPRPGRLQDLLDIDVPRPRDQKSLAAPEFTACSQRIRDGIFGHRAATERFS